MKMPVKAVAVLDDDSTVGAWSDDSVRAAKSVADIVKLKHPDREIIGITFMKPSGSEKRGTKEGNCDD